MEGRFLTLKEVAVFLSIARITVQNMVSRGSLQGYKVGGEWRFDKNEVEAWVKAGKANKRKGQGEDPATDE